jgi:hypothetical protein
MRRRSGNPLSSAASTMPTRARTRSAALASIASIVAASWSSVPASAKKTLSIASNSLLRRADGRSSQCRSASRPSPVIS